MTLAGCFKIHGTPVLFADLLVSRIGAVEDHQLIPTHIDPTSLLPNDWLRIVKGVARKTIQLSNHFVAAGAGHNMAIRSVFRELRSAQQESLECSGELASLLRDIDLGQLEFEICGWHKTKNTDELVSFHWTCNGHFESGGHYIIGSGKDDFHEELSTYLDKDQSTPTDEVQARLRALEIAGNLIGQQQFTGFGLASLFGGGAEVFVYSQGRFGPIDNVAHVNWWANGMKLTLPPRLLLCQHYSEPYLILNSIWNTEEHKGRQEWFCAGPLETASCSHEIDMLKCPQPEFFVNFCMAAFERPKYGFVVMALHDPKHEYMRIERSKRAVGL